MYYITRSLLKNGFIKKKYNISTLFDCEESRDREQLKMGKKKTEVKTGQYLYFSLGD